MKQKMVKPTEKNQYSQKQFYETINKTDENSSLAKQGNGEDINCQYHE